MQKEIHPVKYRKAVISPKAKLFNWVKFLLKDKYGGVKTPAFKKDLERLNDGEPLDYVIGFTEFLGCKIDLSRKPLIPRPETEFWVEKFISSYQILRYRVKSDTSFLDIFSGSGCIGITVLKNIKNAKVVFAEKDKKFLEQIKINLKINNLNKNIYYQNGRSSKLVVNHKNRYRIIQSDIFSNVKGKYNYIFANPPYIATTRKNKIQKSVLQYEPKAALFGGEDGLLYIRKFLAKAKNFLNPGGKIYMEFDSIQKKEIEKLLKKYNYKNWEFHKDQYGKWRWVVV